MSYDLPAMRQAIAESHESNAYGYLLLAINAVLKNYDCAFESAFDLARYYHDPLVSFADRPNASLADVASAMTYVTKRWRFGMGRADDSTLSHFYHYAYERPTIYSREHQIKDKLRDLKIRRGTKKHAQFLEDWASQVGVALLKSAADKAFDHANIRHQQVVELDVCLDKLRQTRENVRRNFRIVCALRDASDLIVDQELVLLEEDDEALMTGLINRAHALRDRLATDRPTPEEIIENSPLGEDERALWKIYTAQSASRAPA